MYFNRALPGRIAPLPPLLWPAFKAIADYSPLDSRDQQLSFMPTPTEPIYPHASPEDLQTLTIERTWEAIQFKEQSSLQSS